MSLPSCGLDKMDTTRRWRVGHIGRDQMTYEEQIDGTWRRLTLDGEMLMGRAHHVIYFDAPAQWQSYPEWARHRRSEIIARITSEFREHEYEYTEFTPPNPPTLLHSDSSHRPRDASTPQQRGALMLAIVLVLSIAGAAGWACAEGLVSASTRWPTARPSQRRAVLRASEPAMFYAAVSVYAVLALATLSLGVWGSGQLWSLRVRQSATGR